MRTGWAATALAVIAALTAAWWALALYPASQAPDWILRTRLACFGARPGELPNAGGWILLVGQPLGLLAILLAVWGDSLARDLRVLYRSVWGRLVLAAASASLLYGGAVAATTVYRSLRNQRVVALPEQAWTAAVEIPELQLVDQSLQRFSLGSLAERGAIVTFAYAHCETVCLLLVREILRLRHESGRDDVPLVVVTVDPWRDVPARLASIARHWGLLEGDRVLSGSVEEVVATLERWQVGWARDSTTGEVSHAAVVVAVMRGARRGVRLEGSLERLPELLRVL